MVDGARVGVVEGDARAAARALEEPDFPGAGLPRGSREFALGWGGLELGGLPPRAGAIEMWHEAPLLKLLAACATGGGSIAAAFEDAHFRPFASAIRSRPAVIARLQSGRR
jgi:hypothetical protein